MLYVIDDWLATDHATNSIFVESDKSDGEMVEILAALEILFADHVEIELQEPSSLRQECLQILLQRYFGCRKANGDEVDYLKKNLLTRDPHFMIQKFSWKTGKWKRKSHEAVWIDRCAVQDEIYISAKHRFVEKWIASNCIGDIIKLMQASVMDLREKSTPV